MNNTTMSNVASILERRKYIYRSEVTQLQLDPKKKKSM